MPVAKEPFCTDCARSLAVISEYAYILKDSVWEESVTRAIALHARRPKDIATKPVPTTKDLCCITCLEERLGRTLTLADFNWRVFLNLDALDRSPLLQLRMRSRK